MDGYPLHCHDYWETCGAKKYVNGDGVDGWVGSAVGSARGN